MSVTAYRIELLGDLTASDLRRLRRPEGVPSEAEDIQRVWEIQSSLDRRVWAFAQAPRHGPSRLGFAQAARRRVSGKPDMLLGQRVIHDPCFART